MQTIQVYLKTLFLTILILLFSQNSFGQLSGNYTVGGSSPNFPNLDSAITYLKTNGITGNVNLLVRTGTYTLKSIVTNISGTNSNRWVKVSPAPGNKGPVIFKRAITASNSNYLLDIKASYLKFDSLNFIVDSSSTYGNIVLFSATCKKIVFNSCNFYGKVTTSTAAGFNVIYNDYGYKSDSISITNCNIYNGSTGICFYGNNTAERGHIITNNKLYDYSSKGIRIESTIGFIIYNNTIRNSRSLNNLSGIYIYIGDEFTVNGNKVYTTGGSGKGIEITECGANSSSNIKVNNNIISGYDKTATGIFNGMYIYYCSKIDIVYNTIASYSADTNSVCLQMINSSSNQNILFKNNNLTNFGLGKILSVTPYNLNTITGWSNNNYYSDSKYKFIYNSNYYSSYQNFIKVFTVDQNSINVAPKYESSDNLRTLCVDLKFKGIPIQGITTDIDGEIRNSNTPDIGADEFNIPTTDLEISQIITDFCRGNQAIKVKIKNNGKKTIDSISVSWKVAIGINSFGSLINVKLPMNLKTAKDTVIYLGSYNFLIGNTYSIVSHLNLINGNQDSLQRNDSAKLLNNAITYAGDFTIGGSNPDFITISNAFAALSAQGVCGPVRLLLRSGTYNEKVDINTIKYLNPNGCVRLVSDPSNSSTPVIKFNNTYSNNYVIRFDNVSNIIIDSITITTSSSIYGGLVQFNGACTNINFNKDSLIGLVCPNQNSAQFYYLVSGNLDKTGIEFNSCYLKNGSCSIFLNNYTNVKDSGLRIINCKLVDFIWGVNCSKIDNIAIRNSYFHNLHSTGIRYSFGIFISLTKGTNIENNFLDIGGNSDLIGIIISGTENNPVNLIGNNEIIIRKPLLETPCYGIEADYTNALIIAHNSVKIENTYPESSALFCKLESGDTTLVYNNYLTNSKLGYAFKFKYKNGGLIKSDYNAYHTYGSYIGFDTINLTNLSNHLAMLKDSNSLICNPRFSNSNSIQEKLIELNNKGKSLASVKKDINGNTRSTSQPDIGVIEFNPPKYDVDLNLMNPNLNSSWCGQISTRYKARILNNGTDSVKKVIVKSVHQTPNNTTISTLDTFQLALASAKADTLYLKRLDTRLGGSYSSKFYFTAQNDNFPSNDSNQFELSNLSATPNGYGDFTDTICDNFKYTVKWNKDSSSQLRWYSKFTNGILLSRADSFTLFNQTRDTSFYVTSVYPYYNNSILYNHNGGTTNFSGGTMFDIKPKRDLFIDSLGLVFTNPGNQKVVLYMKNGTFKGNELNPSKWIRIDSAFLNASVASNYELRTIYKLNKRRLLTKDSLYSFYVFYAGIMNYRDYKLENSDLIFDGGSSLSGKFNTVDTFRTFKGAIYTTGITYCETIPALYKIKIKNSPKFSLGNDTFYCSYNGFKKTYDPKPGQNKYLWSTGDTTSKIEIIKGGLYNVKISNSENCSVIDAIQISEIKVSNFGLGKDTGFCTGTLFNKTFNPGVGFTSYLWSNGSKSKTLKITTNGIYSVKVVDNFGCEWSDTINISKYTSPKPNLGSDSTYCSNDGILKTLDGGIYNNVNWSTNDKGRYLTIKRKGTYAVNVIDSNNCSGGDTINFNELISPSLILPKDTSFCPETGIRTFINAGLFKNYLWSTGEKTQFKMIDTNGVYWCRITSNNGCTDSDTINIEKFTIPLKLLGNDTGYCIDNPFEITLNAGAGFKNYLWSNGFKTQSILAKNIGKYIVFLKDNNNCNFSDTLNIIEFFAKKPFLGKDTFFCSNQGFSKILDPGNYTSYKWNNNTNNRTNSIDSEGTYSVKVYDSNNCFSNDTIIVTKKQSPNAELGPDRVLNSDFPVNETIDAGSGFYKYRWNIGDTSRLISVNKTGTYIVEVESTNGCKDNDTILVRFWNKSGIITTQSDLSITPNPNNGNFTILSNSSIKSIYIIDLQGIESRVSTSDSDQKYISLSNFSSGIYFIRIETENGIYIQKIEVFND